MSREEYRDESYCLDNQTGKDGECMSSQDGQENSLVVFNEEYELELLSQFPQALRDYRARAKQENLVLKFHVFCDRTDDFTSSVADAMALYWTHRYEGQPNVRLFVELQDSDGEEQYEDCLLAYGDSPN